MSTKRHDKAREIARAAIGPLSTLGMHNATLSGLGKTMNMSGAHLLYYFDSKKDLFMAALRVVESDLRDHALEGFSGMQSARQRWDWLIGLGAPTGLDDSGLLMWLEAWAEAVHDPDVLALITELERQWQELLIDTLRYGIERGELPPTTDVPLIVEGVSALLDGVTIRVVVGYRPVDRNRALDIVAAFTDPLLAWRGVEK